MLELSDEGLTSMITLSMDHPPWAAGFVGGGSLALADGLLLLLLAMQPC